MMAEEDELLDADMIANLELQEEENNMVQHIEDVPISLHSLMGEGVLTTMRVVGEVGSHKLNVLADIGSTLSLILEKTFKNLGSAVHNAKPLLVRVANGKKVVSNKQPTNVHLNTALSMRNPNISFYENSEIKFKKGKGTKLVPC